MPRTPSVVRIPRQGCVAGLTVPLSAYGDVSATEVTAYLGIPFAQPPIGALRWRRPQTPAPSWDESGDGEVRASRWPKDPVQSYDLQRMFGTRMRGEQVDSSGCDVLVAGSELADEDCLYVNIWVPNAVTAKAPVLVWVYGGGFIVGATSLPQYDGARLASVTGCIVVSIPYRVGVMGFLGSRELAQDENSAASSSGASSAGTGNYGLWDVVAGLQWVQSSITAFGGDPDKVTAFGESAGAIVLHYLMLSPVVPAGLFARVGLLSGTATSVLPRSMPSSQATYDALASALDPSLQRTGTTPKQSLAMLKNATPQQLIDAFHMLPGVRPRSEYIPAANEKFSSRRMDHDQDSLQFEASSLCGPVWDGVMVPEDFLARIVRGFPAGGLQNGQEGVLLGHTADEGSLFTLGMATPSSLRRRLDVFAGTLKPQVEKLYGTAAAQTDEAAKAISSAILGDYVFVAPVNALTASLARQDVVPAYRYVWSHRPSARLLRSLTTNKAAYTFADSNGSAHGSELPFIFGWQGNEAHTYAMDDYPGREAVHAGTTTGSAALVGFSEEERRLSLQFMQHFALFAKGKAPWSGCHGDAVKTLESVPVMAYDHLPSLGSLSSAELQHFAAEGDDRKIDTRERLLGDTLIWQVPVDPAALAGSVGSATLRNAFWNEDGLRRTLLYYYGDERIHFLP